MLERAIQDDEMLQIGEVHNSNRLALLSDEILNKLAKMQKKNIAVEILNRALKEYVEQVGKENVVLMEKFSTKFQKIALFKHFKTVSAIKSATVGELCAAPTMTAAAAQKVYDYYHK